MKKEKYLTWDELGDLYQERTGQSARIRPMEDIYDWATKQKDITEKKCGLVKSN